MSSRAWKKCTQNAKSFGIGVSSIQSEFESKKKLLPPAGLTSRLTIVTGSTSQITLEEPSTSF